MNKITLGGIVLVVVVVGGFFLFGGNAENTPAGTALPPEPTTNADDTKQTIVIQGHQLPQSDLEIEVGTTVVWENRDAFVGLPYDRHTVTSGVIDKTGTEGVPGVVPNSGSGIGDGVYRKGLTQGGVFSYTFTKPGTYTFYIAEHPLVSGEGRIVVSEKSEPTAEEATALESKAFSFSPNALEVNVGEAVALDITSTGQHTFTIDELNVNVVTPHGETTRVEFVPDTAGTFEFYCAIPGHREAGQVGTIIVN